MSETAAIVGLSVVLTLCWWGVVAWLIGLPWVDIWLDYYRHRERQEDNIE